MADPYADLGSQESRVQEMLANAVDTRAREPAQEEIRRAYLGRLSLADGAVAVELGSGTGHITRDLVTVAGASRAHGIEPSPVMVARAREHFGDDPRLSFAEGDAKATGLADASQDLVVMHTLLCHVPGPEDVISEAFRILKPGGLLAICDGDYDTATAKIAEFDPLDQLVRYMINQNVTNLWIMRQISALLLGAGFDLGDRQGHGYVADEDAVYFLTVLDRGADCMSETGVLVPDTAAALKAEARARIAAGKFFGYMSYVSQIARKPA